MAGHIYKMIPDCTCQHKKLCHSCRTAQDWHSLFISFSELLDNISECLPPDFYKDCSIMHGPSWSLPCWLLFHDNVYVIKVGWLAHLWVMAPWSFRVLHWQCSQRMNSWWRKQVSPFVNTCLCWMTWKDFPHYWPFVRRNTSGFPSQMPSKMVLWCFFCC